MPDIFRVYICVLRLKLYAKIIFGCLHVQWIVVLSAGIWILETPKLQAVTENSVSHKTFESRNSTSELTEQIPSAGKLEKLNPETVSSFESSSVKLHYPSNPLPQLMAVPENFNPGLRLPPPSPPSHRHHLANRQPLHLQSHSFSPSVEADFGYGFSNVRNRDTGGSAYNNQSFTGQLRVKF